MTNSPVPPLVMAGLVPAIHSLTPHSAPMDARNKCGHDGGMLASFVRTSGAGG